MSSDVVNRTASAQAAKLTCLGSRETCYGHRASLSSRSEVDNCRSPWERRDETYASGRSPYDLDDERWCERQGTGADCNLDVRGRLGPFPDGVLGGFTVESPRGSSEILCRLEGPPNGDILDVGRVREAGQRLRRRAIQGLRQSPSGHRGAAPQVSGFPTQSFIGGEMANGPRAPASTIDVRGCCLLGFSRTAGVQGREDGVGSTDLPSRSIRRRDE